MKLATMGLVAGGLVLAAVPIAAQAACAPQFDQAAQTVVVPDLRVNAGATTSETFGIRIKNAASGGGKCGATLRIARSTTAPATILTPYSVVTGGRTLEVLANEMLPGTVASDLAIGQLPQGPNGANFPFRLVVPSGWGLTAGSWTDDLVVILLDENDIEVDRLYLTLSFTIPPAVELRVVGVTGTNAIASINLGNLDPRSVNRSDPFGVRIWSTSPYTVSFRSQNDGGLLHSGASDRIDYRLFMNNVEVSTAGAPAAYRPQGTNALGELHPLSVRVDPFLAPAGDYSDRVEVTVTAN